MDMVTVPVATGPATASGTHGGHVKTSNMIEYYKIGENITDYTCLENVDTRTICVINLHLNQLKDLSGFPHCPFVSEVVLSANQFEQVNFPEWTTSLPSLTHLDLSANLLTHVSDFPFLPKLKVLNLARNDLFSVEGLEASCMDLEVLDISGNPQLDLDQMMDTITCLTNLRRLVLFDNNNNVLMEHRHGNVDQYPSYNDSNVLNTDLQSDDEDDGEGDVHGSKHRHLQHQRHHHCWPADSVDMANYLFSVCLLLKEINGHNRVFWEDQEQEQYRCQQHGRLEEPQRQQNNSMSDRVVVKEEEGEREGRYSDGVRVDEGVGEGEVRVVSTGAGSIPLQYPVPTEEEEAVAVAKAIHTPKLDKLMSMRARRVGSSNSNNSNNSSSSSDGGNVRSVDGSVDGNSFGAVDWDLVQEKSVEYMNLDVSSFGGSNGNGNGIGNGNGGWVTEDVNVSSPMPAACTRAPTPAAPSPAIVRNTAVAAQLQQQAAEYSMTQRKIDGLISNLKRSVQTGSSPSAADSSSSTPTKSKTSAGTTAATASAKHKAPLSASAQSKLATTTKSTLTSTPQSSSNDGDKYAQLQRTQQHLTRTPRTPTDVINISKGKNANSSRSVSTRGSDDAGYKDDRSTIISNSGDNNNKPSIVVAAVRTIFSGLTNHHRMLLSVGYHKWHRQCAAIKLQCSYASFAMYRQLATLDRLATQSRHNALITGRELRRVFTLWHAGSVAATARSACSTLMTEKNALEDKLVQSEQERICTDQRGVISEREREAMAVAMRAKEEEQRARIQALETQLEDLSRAATAATAARAETEEQDRQRKEQEAQQRARMVVEWEDKVTSLQAQHAEELQRESERHRSGLSQLTAEFAASSEKLVERAQTLNVQKEQLEQQLKQQAAVHASEMAQQSSSLESRRAVEAIVLEMRERNAALSAELGSIKLSQEGEIEALRRKYTTQVAELEGQLVAKHALLEETRGQYDGILTTQLQKHGEEIESLKMKLQADRQEKAKVTVVLETELAGVKEKHKSARIREQKYLKHIKELCDVVTSLQGALRSGQIQHQEEVQELTRQVSSLTADRQMQIQQQQQQQQPQQPPSSGGTTSATAGATGGSTGGNNHPLEQPQTLEQLMLSLRIKDKMLDDQAATITQLKTSQQELRNQIQYYDDELIPQYVAAVEAAEELQDDRDAKEQRLSAQECAQYEEEIAALKEAVAVLQGQCQRNKEIEGIYNTIIAKYSSDL